MSAQLKSKKQKKNISFLYLVGPRHCLRPACLAPPMPWLTHPVSEAVEELEEGGEQEAEVGEARESSL
jgi:hypothetical protein